MTQKNGEKELIISYKYTVRTRKERKKERKRTCIAPIVSITRPLSAQMWITQSYLQIHHICLSDVQQLVASCTQTHTEDMPLQ